MPIWSAIRESWKRRYAPWKRWTRVWGGFFRRCVTADHGNAETMIDPVTGGPHTYHTTNPVPFILLHEDGPARLKSGGALRDIAPTMLGVWGVPKPKEMTGSDLRIASK